MGGRRHQKAEIKKNNSRQSSSPEGESSCSVCVENRTLENIPEISTPQHSLNLAESNNRLGGPGAKEQRNLNIDPQGPRTEAQRGEWMYLAGNDGARKKRSFPHFHTVILTTHVFQNVAINSEAWGNKGSLIKIKFLPSG